jgi:hypothetical protein
MSKPLKPLGVFTAQAATRTPEGSDKPYAYAECRWACGKDHPSMPGKTFVFRMTPDQVNQAIADLQAVAKQMETRVDMSINIHVQDALTGATGALAYGAAMVVVEKVAPKTPCVMYEVTSTGRRSYPMQASAVYQNFDGTLANIKGFLGSDEFFVPSASEHLEANPSSRWVVATKGFVFYVLARYVAVQGGPFSWAAARAFLPPLVARHKHPCVAWLGAQFEGQVSSRAPLTVCEVFFCLKDGTVDSFEYCHQRVSDEAQSPVYVAPWSELSGANAETFSPSVLDDLVIIGAPFGFVAPDAATSPVFPALPDWAKATQQEVDELGRNFGQSALDAYMSKSSLLFRGT